MIVSVEHSLTYTYENEVQLGPQILYLQPIQEVHTTPLEVGLEINPRPKKFYSNIDSEGNVQHVFFLDKPTNFLEINMKAKVKMEAYNPFEFMYLPKEAAKLPIRYESEQAKLLEPYLVKNMLPADVILLSNDLLRKSNGITSGFLMAVNQFIFTTLTYEIREEGYANEPAKTLLEKKGSCRDFAVLFAALCQAQGLATRFVSGYYFAKAPIQSVDLSNQLHAWVEVYLPGGGWRGYDPTQNEVVCGHHLSLAHSNDLSRISPLAGYYLGKTTTQLNTLVSLKILQMD